MMLDLTGKDISICPACRKATLMVVARIGRKIILSPFAFDQWAVLAEAFG